MFKKFSIVCGNFETPQEPPKRGCPIATGQPTAIGRVP